MAKRGQKKAEVEIPKHISELELASILLERERVTTLSKELNSLKKSLAEKEENLISRLKENEPVIGSYTANLEQKEGRCAPSWKNEWSKLVTELHRTPEIEEEKVKALYPPDIKDVLIIAVR